jgi:hypothetical protein
MSEFLPVDEAKKKRDFWFHFDGPDFSYKDDDGFYHYIIHGNDGKPYVDKLKGLNAVYFNHYYFEDVLIYEDENKYFHLLKGGRDLLYGKKAIRCYSPKSWNYEYMTKDGEYYTIDRNEKHIKVEK